MTVSESPQNRPEEPGSTGAGEAPAERVSLFLRLWSYGGPSQPLSGLALEQEPEIAEIIRSVIGEGKGTSAEPRPPNVFLALFDDAVMAVSAAKSLQQRFLTYHRNTEPQQVVPCILISRTRPDPASHLGASSTDAENLLGNVNSARILVSHSIYEVAKSVPGLRFSPTPVREAGQTGAPEAIYELLWTDESTYGHLRKATSNRLTTMGRYQLQEEIGRGAMGTVYKAYDQLIGRTVALKTISIDRNTPERDELLDRLKQEAKAAGKLDHANIITIYDVGEEDELLYLSMQFVEGRTLQSVLAESGVPPLATLISWADQILSALGYAHAHGVIHRDLKPANLMLTTQGLIKVLDFGIAKLENTTLTKTGLVVGTPSHMAPEQVTGKKVDQRTDIFALGSVFYELVTREKAFRGDVTTVLYKIVHEEPVPPSLVNPALPGGIDAIIRKALAKDPNERFQNCDEMRHAFAEQAAQLNMGPAATTVAHTASAAAATRPPASFSLHLIESAAPERSLRAWPAVLAVALLLIAAGGTFYKRSQTGAFPVLARKMAAAAHRILPHASSEKPERTASQQPTGSDPATPPSAPQGGAPVSANSPTDASAGNSAAAAKLAPEGSDSAPAPQPTAPTEVASPSGADGAQASSTAMPSAKEPTHEPESSPRAPNQPVTAASGSALPATDENQPVAESARNAPTAPVEEESAKPGAESSSERPSASAGSLSKPPKRLRREPALTVDGFSRHDVPELLREADAAEGRGDYRLARYSYNLILKLEPSNPTARSGLRRLEPASPSR